MAAWVVVFKRFQRETPTTVPLILVSSTPSQQVATFHPIRATSQRGTMDHPLGRDHPAAEPPYPLETAEAPVEGALYRNAETHTSPR